MELAYLCLQIKCRPLLLNMLIPFFFFNFLIRVHIDQCVMHIDSDTEDM